jgi:soluble lytic murein transglycosylase
MERFDGYFPLAVASYNGGPHNMSRWYATWRGRIETDAMVEHIQYDESRDYVKKVTSNYARYVRIYEGQDATVVLPPGPTGDDPAVINF